jgi:transcriptional regulator GlxA family with amidase domain
MQIAILLFDQFNALDTIGPSEVLRGVWGAQVHFIAERAGAVQNDIGTLTLEVDHTLQSIPKPDIIVIPGGLGMIANLNNERVLSWLRSAYLASTWTTSIGAGSLLLGAAGLLHGVKATTHWEQQINLAEQDTTFVHSNFIQSGKIVTAASSSAGIEMALYLVETLTDAPYAQAIQHILGYKTNPPHKVVPTATIVKEIYHWMVMKQRLETEILPV